MIGSSMIGMHADQAYVPGTNPHTSNHPEDVVCCERCDEYLAADNTCEYAEPDPNHPRCNACCRCDQCSADACSRAHTPGTGTWGQVA